MSSVIKHTYDFLIFISVFMCNPNGNPLDDNKPRKIDSTGRGVISSVNIKRCIRDYLEVCYKNTQEYQIYVRGDVSSGGSSDYIRNIAELTKHDPDIDAKILAMLRATYFDIRAFGDKIEPIEPWWSNFGQVLGAVTISQAVSIWPIIVQKQLNTRCAITKESKADSKLTDFANKYFVPYGLYVATGHVSASLAEKAGFTEKDLETLWEAILGMYEENGSADRHDICVPKLIVFEHESKYGSAPAQELYNKVKVELKDELTYPTCLNDCTITVSDDIPNGVTCQLLGTEAPSLSE